MGLLSLQRAWRACNWMNDSLKEGGSPTTWVRRGDLWEPQTEQEQLLVKVPRTEEIRLRAGRPGSPQGKDTAQLCLQLPRERKGRLVSALGGLGFPTGSPRGPPRTAPAPRNPGLRRWQRPGR